MVDNFVFSSVFCVGFVFLKPERLPWNALITRVPSSSSDGAVKMQSLFVFSLHERLSSGIQIFMFVRGGEICLEP